MHGHTNVKFITLFMKVRHLTPYYENIFPSLSRDFKLFLLLRLTTRVGNFSSLDAKEVRRQVSKTNLPITYQFYTYCCYAPFPKSK
jgi:hypothetical protein